MTESSADGAGRTGPLASGWTRALIVIGLCAVLALLTQSNALYSALLRLLDAALRVIVAHRVLGMALFVALAGLSAMLAFFSSAVIVPVAIYTWGKVVCALLLWTGWILGGLCAYGIGRAFGRPVVRSLISAAALARYEDRISNRAPFGLVLLFQLALPSEVPGYVLGLARYRLLKFVAALGIAELPFAVGTVYLGESFLERRIFVFIGLGALGAVFGVWALRTLQRRLAQGEPGSRG